ncbi:hypothetical protein EDD76_104119 [Kineothrix alysoides]|uniref:DUF2029 domain-containing protein n=1 Tax=Kineothrix alysoides TaxID=1469948 RepID=A0A4R1R266_9FIRM|nr:hypothetical protein [Kineothrix alysoides]TCL59382.1 hypothetical protein EDD76_104119 [Kineothrix alysoides]
MRDLIKRVKDNLMNIKGSKNVHKAEWIFVIVVGFFLSTFYLYGDIAHTSGCGIKVWDCLFKGKLSMFYSISYTGLPGTFLEETGGGDYDFAMYVIFALYNFPLWIWEKLSGYSFLEFYVTRLYIKGIVWIFSALSAYLIYKIALECELKKEEAKWASFLFFSSAIFFIAVVVISGYDIISVAFTLLGIYGYLKRNNKCFVLSFAMAVALKMFALWIFIPFVLLREKKVWKIFLYGLAVISVLAIPKIYFASGEKTIGIIAQADWIVNGALFPSNASGTAELTYISMEHLPLMFVGMIAIWLICYFNKKELKNREVIYLCAVVMAIFVLTVKVHPQWGILLLPYIILIIMFHPHRMRENLVLEGVFSVGFILNKAIGYYWTCNLNLVGNMLAPRHKFSFVDDNLSANDYGLSHYISILSEKVGIWESNIMKGFGAAVVVGLIYFLVLNYPRREESGEVVPHDYAKRRKWLTARFAISCLVGILPMIGVIQYLF